MKLYYKNIILTIAFTLGGAASVMAKVKLPSFFSDNMVLQQKASVPLFGEASANANIKVTASWESRTHTLKAGANGKWQVSLKTPSYGGPYTITINDGDTVTLSNILIGEVWLCSGQSNMEMPLDGWGKINNYQQEIDRANFPEIRLLQAEHVTSAKPLDDLKVQHNGWQVCSPETIADFSSTAYFFAKKIYEEKHIPIGLLHSSWGGTVIEAWTSTGALRTIHDFDSAIESLHSESVQQKIKKKYDADMKVWQEALQKTERGDKGKWLATGIDNSWKTMRLPQFWENDALVGFDGIVWFKKEITLPEHLKGQELTFRFYADDDDKVWINGVYIGYTSGYNIQRQYTIPASVWKDKGNVITIRVTDGTGGGGIYGKDDELILIGKNAEYSLAGDWKYAVGVDYRELPPAPYIPAPQNMPTVLYNAMIHPLIKLPIAGVIWYQGESNADRAHQYQTLMPLLIKDWREKFNNKDLPFYYVQLANYMKRREQPEPSAWAELREAQLKTLALPNTGMIVATDIGDAGDIHPKNKQEIGYRLANIALAKTYGVNMPYSGPLYKSFVKKGNAFAVSFNYNNGLKASDGKRLKGFEIAGSDKVFHWADAKIEGDTIIVTSPKIKEPVAVRYNWADNPDGNLTNASGLPASSFRTDEWEGITFGRK